MGASRCPGIVEAVTTYTTPAPTKAVERGGAADVVYVLCLMQAGFLLLAGLGETLLMGGNALYLVPPVAKMAVLFVLAAKVVSGRRRAVIALIVVQAMTLFGFGIQLAAGPLPWVDFTVNLLVLLTNLALPITMIYLCARHLSRLRSVSPPLARALPPPQDPYAPAPLVASATATQVVVPYVVVPTAVWRAPR
jgi:hypothetical protein